MNSDGQEQNGVKPGAIAGGAILLVLGATLLLDRTGLIRASFGQLIGPFVLITLGALIMVEKGAVIYGYRERTAPGVRRPRLRRRGGATSGLWMIGLGVWMLLSQLHIWGLDYHNSWPLVIILSGVMILLRGIR